MLTVQPKRRPAGHHQCSVLKTANFFLLISVPCRVQSTVLEPFIFLETSFLRRLAICSFYVSVLMFVYDSIHHVLQSATEVAIVFFVEFTFIDMRSTNFDAGCV
jgi:hypothetical protein